MEYSKQFWTVVMKLKCKAKMSQKLFIFWEAFLVEPILIATSVSFSIGFTRSISE